MRQAMLGMANSMGIKIKYREEYIEIISSRKEVGNRPLFQVRRPCSNVGTPFEGFQEAGWEMP